MAWDSEALTELANETFSITSSRDPRHFTWGVFAWGDAPAACGGGVGAFHWFADLADLIAFITDLAPAAYMTFDTEAEWLEQCQRLQVIASCFETNPEDAITGLNTELKSLCQIDWIGPLEQLLSGNCSFALKVRARFLNDWEDKPDPVSTNVIAPEELQTFLDFLSEYGF